MKANRLLYLGYHFKKADYGKLSAFREYVQEMQGISPAGQWRDVVVSSVRYNVSLMDYYLFRFYEKSHEERLRWAGTGTMYEYQKKMNPPSKRSVLEHKPTFFQTYSPFIHHKMATLARMKEDQHLAEEVLNNPSGRVVLKSSVGQCGNGIEVHESENFTPETLIARLQETGNDMAEEFVVQHPQLMKLSPSGLNTVRIITQLDSDDIVNILGARLRITVNSPVDNMAAGNIAATIEEATGRLQGPAVYSDITKENVEVHPATGVKIDGFQVPFWEESLQLAKEAARHHTGNRSIGWDIAITKKGPELIEGNHDWCKLLWQLPVKKGLKHELDSYI